MQRQHQAQPSMSLLHGLFRTQMSMFTHPTYCVQQGACISVDLSAAYNAAYCGIALKPVSAVDVLVCLPAEASPHIHC
jgi:hypothetical protein